VSRLRDRVLAVRRRWLAARAAEAALVGGGAAAMTLAAQRLSGPAAALSAACGALAAATLLRERWRGEGAFARELDARLGAQGALSTVCEFQRRADPEPLADLLGERTAAALDRAGWRRAVSPPSALATAALLVGLALAAAVARQPQPLPWSEVEALLGQLEGLARAEPADPGAIDEMRTVLERALDESQASPARRREVERRLERVGPHPEGRLARGDVPSQGAPLAAGESGSTMSPPQAPPRMASNPDPSQGRAEPPTRVDRAATWPARHDAVVERYLGRLPRD
jgi:hypothetical protein